MINLGDIKKVIGAEAIITLADNTELTIGNDRIGFNGLVLDNATSVDGQFTIGAAVTSKLTFSILNDDDAMSPYNFREATLVLSYVGLTELPEDGEEDDDDYEPQTDTVLIGYYNVVDYEYNGSSITLTAYDNLSKLDVPCTELAGQTLSFPITTANMVSLACTVCSVTLADSLNPIPNGTYSITKKPQQWDTMTWHDVISYCAQIGGCYAKTDKYGRVYFDWYDLPDPVSNVDGGSFLTTTTPYSDGADADGGTFDPWNTGDVLDGGTFSGYPEHAIPAPYSMTYDTDDVCITGLKVVLEASDNINADENTQTYTTALYGSDGYVITISGNPFIQTTTDAGNIKDYLGALVTGMYFRPLSASIVEDPTIESGDCAYVTGYNAYIYQCFISHVTYTIFAATQIACDADPISSSDKTRFTAGDRMSSRVEGVTRRIDSVSRIAGNTNQYFWHTDTGQDTGAHITEVPQDEWNDSTSQYYHSGGNLLARSNGIAVRDGLTELAQFKADGIDFYDQQGANVVDIDTNGGYYTAEFYSGSRNNNFAPNTPWVIQITDPYFTNFGSDHEVSVRLNGYLGLITDKAFTADFTETVTLTDGDVTVAYSYANKTFTLTYLGNEASVVAVVNIYWSASITSSSFSFGTRSGTKGAFSGTVGEGLKAEYEDQFVVGRYNNNKQGNIFEVGVGANDSARFNAIEITRGGYVTPVYGCNLVQNVYYTSLTGTYLTSGTIYYCLMGRMLFFSVKFTPKQNISSAVGNITIPNDAAPANFHSAITYPVSDGSSSSTYTTSRMAWCIPSSKQIRIVGSYSQSTEYTFGGVAMLASY